MAIVELGVEHVHVAARAIQSRHGAFGLQSGEVIAVEGSGIESFATIEGTVVIGCETPAVAATLHHHPREREVVLLRGMQGDACAAEEVVAAVRGLATIPLELLRLREQLLAFAVALVLTMAVADVGIAVPARRVVVDVEAGVGSATGVGTCLHGTIIAGLQVLLQHDVDDTRRAFGRELR